MDNKQPNMVGKSLFSTAIGTMSEADSGAVGWQHTGEYFGKVAASTVIVAVCCRLATQSGI